MLLASDGITIGEKWTTVLPSKIDGDFFTVCASEKLRGSSKNFCNLLLLTYTSQFKKEKK